MSADEVGLQDGQLPRVFARLADALDARHDVIDTLDLLVQAVVRYTAAVEAGIVLADADGVLHVVASSSERTADVEETQLGTEQGPCLESYLSRLVVETPDLSAARERWPDFVQVAEERGFRAGYAVPLALRGHRLGALNLFFEAEGAMTDLDAAVAQALAQFATIGIVQRRRLQHNADRSAQLQHALDARVVIEQAKGVLAFEHGVSIDQAFALLRTHAQARDSHIREVAEQIVHQRISI